MATKKSPFKQVMDDHGGKEQLVDAIVGVLERAEGEDKDALKARLQTSSNSKLLRLFATAKQVKEQFGSKEHLVDAILAAMKRHKDVDYRQKLLGFTPARLLDLHRSRVPKAAPKAKG
jgi:hypothetical protein